MKMYNNGQRPQKMYGGGMSTRKPMMYGGTAKKKMQMGGMAEKNIKPNQSGMMSAMNPMHDVRWSKQTRQEQRW